MKQQKLMIPIYNSTSNFSDKKEFVTSQNKQKDAKHRRSIRSKYIHRKHFEYTLM